ncbi:MAG TPA: histidine kinase [Verrucomicrobiae bacterium]|nr:histidine kinase [Verrucomicrobiae bacterium]
MKAVPKENKVSREFLGLEREERYRVSRYLHDTLQQNLVAAKIMLETQSAKRKDEGLKKIAKIVDDALQQSRRLSVELSPPLGFESGLRPALEWLADWAGEQYRVKVGLRFEGKDRAVPEDIGAFIVRGIQEFLAGKASRGASAGSVQMRLKMDRGLRLTIRAEARGDLREDPSLAGIQKRMELLGGSYELARDGTEVSLGFPPFLFEKGTRPDAGNP